MAYDRLSRLKRAFRLSLESAILTLIRSLPAVSRIGIKERLRLVRPMDYTRRPVLLDVDSLLEYNTRLRSCRHEPDTVEWIETHFKAGDVFYDVGANVGAYALLAAAFLEQRARIFAFEPGFMNYHKLCRNVILNRSTGSVRCMQVALSDKTSLDTFYYDNDVIGNSGQVLGSPRDFQGKEFKPVIELAVLAYRLDELIERLSLPLPDHVKIDVDGIEFRVLAGAEKTLASSGVRTALIEMEGRENIDAIVAWMGEKGWKVGSRREHVDPGVYNYLFVRR